MTSQLFRNPASDFATHAKHDICFFKYTDSKINSLLYDIAGRVGTYNNGDTFILPSYFGEGMLKNIEVEEGLYLRSFDFTPWKDLSFTRLPAMTDEKFFQLYFFLDKPEMQFSIDEYPLKEISPTESVFMQNDVHLQGLFYKNIPVKMMVIMFTPQWVIKNYLQSHFNIDASSTIQHKENAYSLQINHVSVDECRLFGELHKMISAGKGDILTYRINTLILLNKFIAKAAIEEENRLEKIQSIYMSEFIKVEDRLKGCLMTSLPCIKDLAKEFNLSESTFKRHFKIVFDKNIYQYYLEKKMELAKEMIEIKQLSVATTAYTLGYEKVSSLTAAFKKVYNVVPKSLKIKKTEA